MSLINVTHVEVLDNPTRFTNPFQFEITFECLPPGIQEELEWKLVYVGSAEDEKYDQELDSVLVGPVVVGKNKFVFQAPAPDPSLIPAKDLMEVTVLLLTCSYREKEFIRIGYYVNNDYPETEVALVQARAEWKTQVEAIQAQYSMAFQQATAQQEAAQSAHAQAVAAGLPPPAEVQVSFPSPPVFPPAPDVDVQHLSRNILADKPRVTRFQIPWDEAQAQEFMMDAADEAKANEEAARADESKEGEGMTPADEEEEEEEEDEDDEMDDGEEEGEGEGEEGDDEPQSMQG